MTIDTTSNGTANGKVDLARVRIDVNKLKLRELAEIEKQLGRRVTNDMASGDLGVDMMQALLWLELRKQDPATTFEATGEYEIGELASVFGDNETEDDGTPLDPPTARSGDATGESSPAPEPSKPALSSATSTG